GKVGTAPGGRGSSAKPSGLPSPRIVTRSGKSAPHMPGPWIGRSSAMPEPCFTVPDLRHETSASCRHAGRSSNQLRPQASSRTRTHAPTRYLANLRAMARKMRAIPLRIAQFTLPPAHSRRFASAFFNTKNGGRRPAMPLGFVMHARGRPMWHVWTDRNPSSLRHDRHGAGPAGGAAVHLHGEAHDLEAVGRQQFEIVQLLEMRVADLA